MLTAQYSALYGDEFLPILVESQIDEPLFSFLKPDKPFFQFFASLVSQYKMILNPSPILKRQIEQEADSILNVKSHIESDLEYQKQKVKKEETVENLDFTHFHVVGVVDFENPLPSIKLKTNKNKITQISPITGQEVDIEEFNDHLKFGTINPQYKQQIEMLKARRAEQNSSLVNGNQMMENLNVYVKDTIEPDPNVVVWDGNESTIPKVLTQASAQFKEVKKPQKKKVVFIGPKLPTSK